MESLESFTNGISWVAESEQPKASSGKNFAVAGDTDKSDTQDMSWRLTSLTYPVDREEHKARGSI